MESFFSSLELEENKSAHEVWLYQQMNGSLLYVALRTSLDILATVLMSVHFKKAPNRYCSRAVRQWLRYLRGTVKRSLFFQSGDMLFNGDVYSAYPGDNTGWKSLSGYVLKLGSCACFYGARKQAFVALYNSESEYYAPVMTCQELLWLSWNHMECGIPISTGIVLRSDNQPSIDWAVGERFSSGSAKHIDVTTNFIGHFVKSGPIRVEYVTSGNNDADMLTKPPSPAMTKAIMERVGLIQELKKEFSL